MPKRRVDLHGMRLAAASSMRSLSVPGRDPLYLFLLGSLGLAQLTGCGASVTPGAPVGAGQGGGAGASLPMGTGGSVEAGTGPVGQGDAALGGMSAGTGGRGDMGSGSAGTGGPSGTSAGTGGFSGMSAGAGGLGGTSPATGGRGGARGGSAGSGGMTLEGVLPCNSPTAYQGDASGLVSCEGGFVHRATAGKCAQTPLSDNRYPNVTAGGDSCQGDSDCQATPNGRCYASSPPLTRCISTCESDADCASGQICLCDAAVNHCVSATCTSDADCGPGLLCTNLLQHCGSDLGPFGCQKVDDQCTAHCPGGACSDTGGSRVCVEGAGGQCGRPFLIAGRQTLAAAESTGAWASDGCLVPSLTGLTPARRRALAEQFRDAALMEHASIAAFARFTLELLALGAPPSLVADATSAMADEQRHAAACFALASAYAGSPVGPGALDVRGCLDRVELEHVVVTTFLEGCIGETVAAMEARESAHHVADPVLERTLSAIAADEARHAALAWRFVKWALALGGERTELLLRRELESALARANDAASRLSPTATLDPTELADGVLSPAWRAALRRTALEDVVAPCLGALSARPATSSPGHSVPDAA